MSLWECPRDKQQPVATDKPRVGSHPRGDSAWIRASATTPCPEHTQVALATGGITQIRKNRNHTLLLNINVLLIMEHQSPVGRFPDFCGGFHLTSTLIRVLLPDCCVTLYRWPFLISNCMYYSCWPLLTRESMLKAVPALLMIMTALLMSHHVVLSYFSCSRYGMGIYTRYLIL